MLITHSVLVAHPAARVCEVIADVRRYPEFLPGCQRVEVSDDDGDAYVTEMRVALLRVAVDLRTRTRVRSPDAIEVRLERGPFRSLEIDWAFRPLSRQACKVEFAMRCELSPLLQRAIGASVFERVSGRFIDAFVARIDELTPP